MENGRRTARQILILFIKGYQYLISPLLGHCCRFYPSCSHYATEAITLHGVAKGFWLSVKRILRCHPWHPGGVDLVPGSYNIYSKRLDLRLGASERDEGMYSEYITDALPAYNNTKNSSTLSIPDQRDK